MTQEQWSRIRYFKSSEFDSPDLPGSGVGMSWDLVSKLDCVRQTLGGPIKINSGIRTPYHNEKVGGKSRSAHLIGEAVDISAKDPAFRFRLFRALIAVGFTRFEVTPWHIHVDSASDEAHPSDILLTLDTRLGKLV